MKIAYLFNRGRLNRLTDARKGLGPSEFFYGAIELEKKGHTIGFLEIDVEWAPGFIGGIINKMADKQALPEKMNGGIVIQIHRMMHRLRKFDCIVGTTSGIAFSIAFWKLVYGMQIPVIAIHCGLLNNKYSAFRKFFTHQLLKKQHTVLFGNAEKERLIDLFPDARRGISINQFGVDTCFWVPGGVGEKKYILAVGNDGRRDYEILIEAAKKLSVEVKILTSLLLPEELPRNVTRISGSWHNEAVSDCELRALYQNALCVVVPLKESHQPSGQSVTLQAMACGCPVLLTRTSGLWSTDSIRDGENILLLAPNDPKSILDAVQRIQIDEAFRKKLGMNGRSSVVKFATADKFSERMGNLCVHALHSHW